MGEDYTDQQIVHKILFQKVTSWIRGAFGSICRTAIPNELCR